MRKTHLAIVMGLALVVAAGAATAAYAGQSIWGTSNPGRGAEHAAMPAAGADHNQAGAEHPPEFANGGGQPDGVPPEDPGNSGDAGMPDSLPDQANEHAQANYPPVHESA
jgi:hypothetical protein